MTRQLYNLTRSTTVENHCDIFGIPAAFRQGLNTLRITFYFFEKCQVKFLSVSIFSADRPMIDIKTALNLFSLQTFGIMQHCKQ
jgi:hypothetical protein